MRAPEKGEMFDRNKLAAPVLIFRRQKMLRLSALGSCKHETEKQHYQRPVAQLAAQQILNLRVVGSTPTGSTKTVGSKTGLLRTFNAHKSGFESRPADIHSYAAFASSSARVFCSLGTCSIFQLKNSIMFITMA